MCFHELTSDYQKETMDVFFTHELTWEPEGNNRIALVSQKRMLDLVATLHYDHSCKIVLLLHLFDPRFRHHISSIFFGPDL